MNEDYSGFNPLTRSARINRLKMAKKRTNYSIKNWKVCSHLKVKLRGMFSFGAGNFSLLKQNKVTMFSN